jgi:NAD(P)H dehydrogenase (quinone)
LWRRYGRGDLGRSSPLENGLVFQYVKHTFKARVKVFGDSLENLWKNCIFAFYGIPESRWRMFSDVVTSAMEERDAWLNEVQEQTR